jgi:adhesin/invasin
MLSGDLNGDHLTDLALIYGGKNATIVPFFATGGGAMRKGASSNTGITTAYSVSAAIGDVNKDGYGDLAIATSTGVQLMLGSSGGVFKPGAAIANPGAGAVVLADFDKDGKLDLATTSSNQGSSAVKVYFGDGQGGFASPSVYPTLSAIVAMIAADVNETGNIDLVLASYDTGSLSLLLNTGNGYFYAARNMSSPQAVAVAAADFNRDGLQDIAVLNKPSCKAPCNGTVTVFMGSGKNYFNPGQKYSIGMHGTAIAAGDLNRDGIQDLVIVNATSGDNSDLSVLLGNKDGTFQQARNYLLGSLSNDVYLADVNHDGILDLVEDVGVALGKGDGSFGSIQRFGDGFDYGTHSLITVGDFNGDGWADVAYANFYPGCTEELQILLNNKTAGFTAGQAFYYHDTDEPFNSLAVGKASGGNALDIVSTSAGADCTGYFASHADIYKGNGDGSFQERTGLNGVADTGPGIRGDGINISGPIAIADFNQDGRLDIGIAGDKFYIYPGSGKGTFAGAIPFTGGRALSPNSAVVADFERNGMPDVVIANPDGISRLYGVRVPMVTPGSLDWTQSGTSKVVTIKNTLSTTERIGASLIAGQPQQNFLVISNTCATPLAPGASCTVTLQFNLPSNYTSTSVILKITDNYQVIADIPLTWK